MSERPGVRILVIDDGPGNPCVLATVLTEALDNCVVRVVATVTEGLAAAHDEEFDSLLVDVGMPERDGAEVCRRLKADAATKHLPLLLFTSREAAAELRAAGLAHGADDLISRPIDNAELIARVRVMVRLGTTERRLRGRAARLEDLATLGARDIEIRMRVNDILLTAPDEDAYHAVLSIAQEALESKHGVFGYIDSDGNLVCPSLTRDVWTQCEIPDKSITFPRANWIGVWATTLLEHRAVVKNHGLVVPDGHVSVHRALATPVLHRGESIGLLMVANRSEDYDAHHLATLVAIAEIVAPVLHARRQRDVRSAERDRAEAALRASERRMDLVLTAADLGTWDWNIETGEVQVNERSAQMLGYSQDELERALRTWEALVHPEDRSHSLAAARAHLNGDTDSYDVDHRVRHKSGRWMWVQSVGRVIERDAAGRPLRACGTHRDVSRRERVEDILEPIVAGTAGATGLTFFKSLVRNIARSFKMRYVLVGELIESGQRVRTVAAWADGEVDDIEYALAGTPCANVVRNQACVYDQGVQQLFPDDELLIEMNVEGYCGAPLVGSSGEHLGLLAVMDVKPLPRARSRMLAPLSIFAARASAELERMRLEDRLRAGERRFRGLSEMLPVGIFETNSDLTITYSNRAGRRLFGYSREHLKRGIHCLDLVAAHDRERARERLATRTREELRGSIDCMCVREDGTEFPALLNADAIIVRGAVAGLRGVILDITDRKRTEEERERLAVAIEQAGETVMITDADGTIEYVNAAFERITGYSREDVLGENPRLLKSGEHDARFYEEIWKTLGNSDVWRGRVTNRRKDGTLFTEDAAISPVLDTSGRVMNYVAVKRDVTAELRLQRQFLESQKLESVGRLASGIAHDFNNLLTVMGGYGEALADRLRDDKPLFSKAQQITRAAGRASDLTRQLLAFSSNQRLEPRELDVNSVLQDVHRMLGRLIGADIELQINPAEHLWAVSADPGQLEQVIMNLAVNARDAMPAGGTLMLETRNVTVPSDRIAEHPDEWDGRHVLLAVSDTGTGMAEVVRQQVFEPFFTTKERGKGTGLGLSTVYGIVKQSGGTVAIRSQVGIGTTVDVHLPAIAARPTAAEARPERAPELEAPGGSETILLVEDEEGVREFAAAVLVEAGYRVITANDGAHGLAAARDCGDEFELLLTDVEMPRLGGPGLAASLEASRPGLSVLFTTGYAGGVAQGGPGLGPDASVLLKPYSPDALLRKVREVLDADSRE